MTEELTDKYLDLYNDGKITFKTLSYALDNDVKETFDLSDERVQQLLNESVAELTCNQSFEYYINNCEEFDLLYKVDENDSWVWNPISSIWEDSYLDPKSVARIFCRITVAEAEDFIN